MYKTSSQNTNNINRIIVERIKDPLISTVDAEQAGFRAGSLCTDHINAIRMIIEQCKEFRLDLHVIFIDFEKAFDSVNRDCIWQALRSRSIPEYIIAKLHMMVLNVARCIKANCLNPLNTIAAYVRDVPYCFL